MFTRRKRKQARKQLMYICVLSIILSNISLAAPSKKFAVEVEQNNTAVTESTEQTAPPEVEPRPGDTPAVQEPNNGDTPAAPEPVPIQEETTPPTTDASQDNPQPVVQEEAPKAEEKAAAPQVEVGEENFNSLPKLLITEISPDSAGTDYF